MKSRIRNKITPYVFLALFVVLAMSLVGHASRASAAGEDSNSATTGYSEDSNSSASQTTTLQNPLKVDSIGGLVQNFVEIFSYIVVLLAVLVLIYIGFQYIMASAQGNSSKIKELHSWLLWTVVGLAVVIGARVAVQVVINTLSATHTINQNVLDSATKAASGK